MAIELKTILLEDIFDTWRIEYNKAKNYLVPLSKGVEFLESTNSLVFKTGSLENVRMSITNSGNVLIGTETSDKGKLLIGSTGNNFDPSTGNNSLIQLKAGNPQTVANLGMNGSGLHINMASSGGVIFGSGSTEHLRLTGDGKVGIGTNDPKSKLHVEGGIIVSGSIDSEGTDFGFYDSVGTNLILKGDSNGRSGIFFQSEKDGTNINHPSDYGFIQYHAYGHGGTTGENAAMVIGVSNDSTDSLVLQAPFSTGVKVGYKNETSGDGLTLQTVFHDGYHPNADTLTTARTISLSGDVTGSVSFNGSSNVSITTAVVDNSHNHTSNTGNYTVGGDLTVSGGDIVLGGTGRIQGVDTVSASTDAANKAYVDSKSNAGANAGSVTTSGTTRYSILPGGLKLAWGVETGVPKDSDTARTVSLPFSYSSSTTYNVMLSTNDSNGDRTNALFNFSRGTNSFVIGTNGFSPGSTGTVYWFTVGI